MFILFFLLFLCLGLSTLWSATSFVVCFAGKPVTIGLNKLKTPFWRSVKASRFSILKLTAVRKKVASTSSVHQTKMPAKHTKPCMDRGLTVSTSALCCRRLILGFTQFYLFLGEGSLARAFPFITFWFHTFRDLFQRTRRSLVFIMS